MPPSNPPSSRLPAWLKALLAQLGGVAAAFAAGFAGAGSGALLIGVQAATAALIAWALRSDPWWIPIHLAFAPLAAMALSAGIDPRWYLAAAGVLLLVFWGSFGTRVPLYLSGREAVDAVDGLLPARRPLRVLDIGCGTGAMLLPLARRHPDCRFSGIESAPFPWLIARVAARKQPNLRLHRGDFFAHDWGDYDVVYAFLSPHPMGRVEDKARAELPPHALLISKDFPTPALQPVRCIELPSGAMLYAYRPGADSGD